jgi:hypothetical protein
LQPRPDGDLLDRLEFLEELRLLVVRRRLPAPEAAVLAC